MIPGTVALTQWWKPQENLVEPLYHLGLCAPRLFLEKMVMLLFVVIKLLVFNLC